MLESLSLFPLAFATTYLRDEKSSTYEKQAIVSLTPTLPGIRASELQALCRPKQAYLLCQK